MELRDQRTAQSYQQAIEKHLSALTIWHNVNDKFLEGRSFLELGEIYGDTGQYQKAFDSYSQARALFKTIGSLTAEANVMSNTAWIYGQLEDNQKALETYDQVAEIYRTVGDIDAITMSNIGSSYAALGEYKRALDIHLRVLEMRRAANERARQAITLSNIGNCYYNLNDKRKALDYYQQALVLMPGLKDDFYTATTLNDIGVIYRELGQYAEALDYLNRSLTLRRTVGDVRGVAFSLTHLARLERERGNLLAARKFVEEALERAESLRYKIGSTRLRATYFASVHRSRDIYIDVLMRLHKKNPSEELDRAAFNASETARARSLLEQLTEASKEIRHGVDPTLLESERTVGETIAKEAANQIKLLSGKHTEEEANAVAKKLATLTTDYEQIQSRIRESSPQYAALVQPAPLKIDEIQQRVLDADTLLLQYSLGQETSYLWAVTPDSIKTYELPKRSVIEPLARRVYELLTARNVNVPSSPTPSIPKQRQT
jgi:tetratricopeptide (TPR) repeat protein